MTVYMYAYNVLLTNTCNMYEIKILLLLFTLQKLYNLNCQIVGILYFNHFVVYIIAFIDRDFVVYIIAFIDRDWNTVNDHIDT